ncbi:MAG: dolichol-phosphate mannosyltransferase [Hirschia sp.]|nr:dolichol-phosphate mannosyltransferase [Hirschia sp.]MBF17743.1 dolichol-phosphate mannosyltransferase [Hirschia sp.]
MFIGVREPGPEQNTSQSQIVTQITVPNRPEISIVVPVHNETGNVGTLVAEIAVAMEGRAYEMIFVDDASTDDTRAALTALKAEFPTLRVLGHRQNAGQSRAIRSGVMAARGAVIATIDGDGQNDPADLPSLVSLLTRADAPAKLGLVQGERQKRQDSAWKKFGSRLANSVRQKLLDDGHNDSGCGAKAYFREAFLQLPYFDHMHRYMPALMRAEGFVIEAAPVNHRGRMHGVSKYTNFGRLVAAWSDLRGVLWLRKRRRQPGGADEM